MNNRTRRVIVGFVAGCAWTTATCSVGAIVCNFLDVKLPWIEMLIVISSVGIGTAASQLWRCKDYYR